jgi:hypothetical protein
MLHGYFARAHAGFLPRHRICQAVLPLPDDFSAYLKGRHRQAVRTNLRRATAAGVCCEELLSDSDIVSAWEQVTDARGIGAWLQAWRDSLSLPGTRHFAARAATGAVLAVLTVTIDEHVALIQAAVASEHPARWKLHAHLVELLCERRVRYLFVTGGGLCGALGLSPATQYFQHLLGYGLCHVRLERP